MAYIRRIACVFNGLRIFSTVERVVINHYIQQSAHFFAILVR